MRLQDAAGVLAVIVCNAVEASHAVLRSLDTAPVAHFTLFRRGGGFSSIQFPQDIVNLTHLTGELSQAESRFNLTKRVVKGNKLVRKAKNHGAGGREDGGLMGDVATSGIWVAKVKIGDPPQEIEMDLNMLVSDFYVVTTTSRSGSKYDDYFSKSSVMSDQHPFPSCRLPSDLFFLPIINESIPLSFAHCRPNKFSSNTLGPSGSTLGLAPSEHLSQLGTVSILKQLLEKGAIKRPVFSLMLINSHEGVLSLGGTAADAVDMVVSQTKNQLDRLGDLEQAKDAPSKEEKIPLERRSRGAKEVITRGSKWEDGWAWSQVQGADGWWQILMQTVWVDGSTVLKNQAVVVDVNSPFILAPPLAAKAFYAGISGSYPLPPPHSNFYAFPCLNPPMIAFEFGGKRFPFMHSPRGQFGDWGGLVGGRFSLGRLKTGSGYCVGAVVETRMGLENEKDELIDDGRKGSQSSGAIGGNGMRDVWVIGEGFFRGVGGAFDFEKRRVGFRAY